MPAIGVPHIHRGHGPLLRKAELVKATELLATALISTHGKILVEINVSHY
jgi:hypothetical protein